MDFRLIGGLTLEEALQMAYSDNLDVSAIYMEPPDPNILTDEDSGEEDDGGLVDNLNRRQLTANVEMVVEEHTDKDDGKPNERSEEEDEEKEEEEEVANNRFHEWKRPGKDRIEWTEGDLIPRNTKFPKPDFTNTSCLTIVETFEKFIDEDIIAFLVDQSRKYALFLNEPDPRISSDEMKCCIAVMILTGYCKLPGRDYYWSSEDDMKNVMITQAMRRDRFRQILKYIHCADNTKPNKDDKIWKLRPFMEKLKTKFLQNWIPEECLDYDESMIKYFGRHSCKQFIRGKPIRFGYKMWCMNAPSGYLINFDMYQGKNPKGNADYETEFGKCTAPLLNMIDEFPDAIKRFPFRFYIDNLFTNFNVLYYMKENGHDATGTIRDNRVPKSCPLPDKKSFMKRNKRGDFVSAIDKTDGIILVKWLDNNVVSAASTCHGISPLSTVKRYSQKEKKIVQISRPSIIAEYNKFMGGTDRLDENVSKYRISIRRKKWWWPIFTWLIDVAVTNAWTLYKQSHSSSLTQLEFRREIVKTYLTRYKMPPKGGGRPSTSKSSITLNRVSDDIRYDRRDHLLVYNEGKKKRRCAGEGCSSIIITICKKCNVGLCIECNEIFHTK